LPRNTEIMVLERRPQPVPDRYPFGDDELVPMRAGESVAWRIVDRMEPQ
jgi:dihydroorotase